MDSSLNYLNSKPRYEILDGLRGVAAVTVVAFHLFEAHATSHFDQVINHGYLAVDFFFVLSGFVIGYAYDDRWGKMTAWGFFKRRLIRLHPMVILGTLIGAICFYFGASSVFPPIAVTPLWAMLLATLAGCVMLPLPPSMDIRGWEETYPLNGPAWSLMFEYIANILYATVIRRLPTKLLAAFVFVAACVTLHFSLTMNQGTFIGGWALDQTQLHIGFIRLIYPFFAGLLLFRLGKLIRVKHAFWVCSLLILIVLAMPRIGGRNHLWLNGLYESSCVILLFPLIVSLGAGGALKGKHATKICTFLGRISYPLYITHYPLIYIYTAWVGENKLSMRRAYPVALIVWFASIALAYTYLRLYDEPVRNWLKARFLIQPPPRNSKKDQPSTVAQ